MIDTNSYFKSIFYVVLINDIFIIVFNNKNYLNIWLYVVIYEEICGVSGFT